jgi:tetratricopeptide (TPR) repeat protein
MKHHITLAVLVAFAGQAVADKDKDKADSLFKQGKKLMAEKRYAEACAAFEQSFKLDPGIGGELNIAKCYEEWGKVGRAYSAYQHAEQMAKEASDPREPKIHDLVAGLEPQVPKLTIKLSSGSDPKLANATLDDKPIEPGAFGQPQIVDPGPHTIEYESNGKKKKRVVPVERGGTSEITLDIGAGAIVVKQPDVVVKKEPEPPPPAPRDPGRNQKFLAYGAAGVGVVLIGVSSAMTLSAKSRYDSALTAHCGGSTTMCDSTGLSITHDARHEANIATALFLVGLVGVGGGVALYLTAPHAPKRTSDEHSLYIVPTVAPGAAGVVFGGSL